MDYKLGITKRALWGTLRPFVKAWMRLVMRPVIINSLPKDLKPPYLIISNHAHAYDGLIVSLFSPQLPVPVFDDIQKLNPFIKSLFTYTGVVFKSYGLPDAKSIRSMIKAKNAGRLILLYPEGEINWTGEGKLPEINVARLIKLLKIPVVLVKTKGAYAKQPKWALVLRKGRCIFDFRLLLTSQDITSYDEIYILEKLQSEIKHNDLEWLKTPEAIACGYFTNQPSKGLARWLFCCPSCKGSNCMSTEEVDAISCNNCGYTVGIDSYLNVLARDIEPVIKNLQEWGRWQKSFWQSKIAEAAASSCEADIILRARCRSIRRFSVEGKKESSLKQCEVLLSKTSIEAAIQRKSALKLALSEILVCHCYRFTPGRPDSLILRTKEFIFVIDLSEPYSPPLSWELALNALMLRKH